MYVHCTYWGASRAPVRFGLPSLVPGLVSFPRSLSLTITLGTYSFLSHKNSITHLAQQSGAAGQFVGAEARGHHFGIVRHARTEMLHAQKQALENRLRQRLVAIREQELEYYTKNCRMLGNLAALVAGFSYAGIRYHYLLERTHSWMVREGDAIEEVLFLSLLTVTMGIGLQTVLVAMLVAMLAPSLALRGPDGSLGDAVAGMSSWTAVTLAHFMASLVMLEMSALSFCFGHSKMNVYCRAALMGLIILMIWATVHNLRIVIRKFWVSASSAVSGAFFRETDRGLEFDSAPFSDMDSAPFSDVDGISKRGDGAQRIALAKALGMRLDGEDLTAAAADDLADGVADSSLGDAAATATDVTGIADTRRQRYVTNMTETNNVEALTRVTAAAATAEENPLTPSRRATSSTDVDTVSAELVKSIYDPIGAAFTARLDHCGLISPKYAATSQLVLSLLAPRGSGGAMNGGRVAGKECQIHAYGEEGRSLLSPSAGKQAVGLPRECTRSGML